MAENKMKYFEEEFECLQISGEHFSLLERLTKASEIRDLVLGDSEITAACDSDETMVHRRTSLLWEIKKYQDSVINSVSIHNIDVDFDGKNIAVKDFDRAIVELANLVKDELSLYESDGIPDIIRKIPQYKSHLDTLHQVSDSCKNQKYIVLMIGEYQSGKTTTLNALCDGHHIGAMGNGTATSAVPISVTYSDEYDMRIEWRTKEQLQEVFIHLNMVFDDFVYAEFNLDNTDHRSKWLSRIEEIRTSKDCPLDVKGIAICSLILKYYSTDKLSAKKDSTKSVSEIHSATRFPDDFESRWVKKGVDSFSIDESIFAFIDSVECWCPSDTLKELNCTLIDSPGLFYNQYDTAVTENLMKDAHAILYLLPHIRAEGHVKIESLNTIKNNYKDFHRKLYIVQNVSVVQYRDTVYNVNASIVQRLFGESQCIVQYDAHLAYLARIKQSYSNGILSEDDKKDFAKPVTERSIRGENVIDFHGDFDEAFKYHYYKRYNNIPLDSCEDESGINDLITDLKRFIEHNEAYSIIVSSGVNKLDHELKILQSDICLEYISPYLLGKENIEKFWNNLISKAESLSDVVKNEVDKVLCQVDDSGSSMRDKLVKSIYDKLFNADFYNTLCIAICNAIYDNKAMVTTQMSIRGFNKEAYINSITPIINDVVRHHITAKITYWKGIMESGQDQDFATIFSPKMEVLTEKLKSKWNEIFSGDIECDSYIRLKTNIKDYIKCPNQNVGIANISYSSRYSQVVIPATLLAEIAAVAASVATGIGSAIALAIGLSAAPMGWILFLVGGAALTVIIMGKSKDWIRNKFIEYMKPDLYKMYKECNIYDELKEIISKEVDFILEFCKSSIIVDVDKMRKQRDNAISTPETESEQRCFTAADTMTIFNNQRARYRLFKDNNITHGND